MISLTSSIRLATVRLRAHWLHTTVTVVFLGILFGLAAGSVTIFQWFITGLDQFKQHSLSSKFIVQVNTAKASTGGREVDAYLAQPSTLQQAKDLLKQRTKDKTKLSRQLKLPYSSEMEATPFVYDTDSHIKSFVLPHEDNSGIIHEILAKRYSQPAINDNALQRLATTYGATKFYHATALNFDRAARQTLLTPAGEAFDDATKPTDNDGTAKDPLPAKYELRFSPAAINQQFLFPDYNGWRADSGEIPILLSMYEATQLLGLPEPNANSDIETLRQFYQTVQQRLHGYTYQVCYRNKASLDQITDYFRQQAQLKDPKVKRADKPKLLYQLPDPQACGNVTIASDKRTKAERRQDDNQAKFDRQFNRLTDAVTHRFKFRVVGLAAGANKSDDAKSSALDGMLAKLIVPSDIGTSVPQQLFTQLPDATKAPLLSVLAPDSHTLNNGYLDQTERYIEFDSIANANRFLTAQTCTPQPDNTCTPEGRQYTGQLVFSNAGAINDLEHQAQHFLFYGAIITLVVAALLLYILIGRSVADSRHEVAVFRAIGFKRIDIALITVVYVLLVAILIILVASGVGYALAYYANSTYSTKLAQWLTYMFGLNNTPASVSLIHFDKLVVGYLAGIVLGASLLAAIIPTILSVRRSPLKNLKEE